jgi:hypothetical protein
MLDYIIAGVVGAICWEKREEIKVFAVKLYEDLVEDSTEDVEVKMKNGDTGSVKAPKGTKKKQQKADLDDNLDDY